MLEASNVADAEDKAAAARAKEKARVARYLATDKAKATRRAYYEANAETIKQRAREWKLQNPDKARASTQASYRANADLAKQRTREWNAANPEAARARGRNYRARKAKAEGHHTADDVLALFAKQAGRCPYCRKALGKDYQVDHIKPLSKGGSNWPSNLQLACGPCNNRKRATDPIAFAQRLGLLL